MGSFINHRWISDLNINPNKLAQIFLYYRIWFLFRPEIHLMCAWFAKCPYYYTRFINQNSREGSLCSPPSRLGRKYLVLCTEVDYVVKNNFLHTAGAGRTYSKLLFWETQFSEIIYNSYQPQNDRLELPYVVKNTISRAAGARCARSESLPWIVHMGG